ERHGRPAPANGHPIRYPCAADVAPPPPQPAAYVPPITGGYGPLLLLESDDSIPDILPNGIDGARGELLVTMDSAAARTLAVDNPEPDNLRELHNLKEHYAVQFPLIYGVDYDDLAQTRWAVIVNSTDDAAVLKALTPLIAHRSRQQGITLPPLTFRTGETCGEWLARHLPDPTVPWQQRPPVLLYHPGETCTAWLERHGVTHAPVDPVRGVPFYLLLVGRPGPVYASDTAYIDYSFQYELDMFWGVGRLCFNDAQGRHVLSDYTAYAEQVVDFEQGSPTLNKHVVYFGTRHDLDTATERSADELITPLVEGHSGKPGPAPDTGFTQSVFLAGDATRTNLERILRGDIEHGPPALLFTATHGIGLPADDPRLLMQQGALLCQDWTGFGNIQREHWFAAEDLETATRVSGLIAVCFACYGVGCPHEDEFVFVPGKPRPVIAPYPLVAQLPQRLLARGALAVLGHVDRAWSYSFSGMNVPAQSQPFEDVLIRALSGGRMGFVTDQLNLRQGAASSLLTNTIEQAQRGLPVDTRNLAALWVARNDARNYALLGDPAVRLPVAAKGSQQ
ncbi:MAG: peptidase C1, partial [Chloroflexaceae bacterium]|nr:peptidase C1 [Chloroflexaceae bacterium]